MAHITIATRYEHRVRYDMTLHMGSRENKMAHIPIATTNLTLPLIRASDRTCMGSTGLKMFLTLIRASE